MAPLARIANAILTYRLSYNQQRPYPWRYTTPIVLLFFLLVTILLVLVNIPLSAYDIVTVSTYSPNDTATPLPFKNLIPGYLRPDVVSFTPQTLTTGEMIRPNGSHFNYEISQVYDSQNTSQTAFSLSYWNNPMSDCDVSLIKFRLFSSGSTHTTTAWALISCWSPVPYTFTWTFDLSDPTSSRAYNPSWYHVIQVLSWAWPGLLISNAADKTFGITDVSIMARPCCNCEAGAGKPIDTWITPSVFTNLTFLDVANYGDNVGLEDTQFLMTDHPPCDSEPVEFLQLFPVTNTSLSAPTHMSKTYPGPTAAIMNAFIATYHILRLDLGIIRPNQIYTSSNKLNASLDDPAHYPNQSWRDTCTGVACYQPLPAVPTSFRTVAMSYVKPVFKRKPIASAMVSVFVSTFAMISALWAIFNLVAGILARNSDADVPAGKVDQAAYLMTDYDDEIPPHVMERIKAVVRAEWKIQALEDSDDGHSNRKDLYSEA